MQITQLSPDLVHPYPNNPRVLKSAAQKVADSIRHFGFRQPIVVDAEHVVIIGHARLAAAKLLKLETVPVHIADNLSEDQVRALRIADNKTSEFAEWDDAKLHDELSALMSSMGDVDMTGFTQSEFDAIDQQIASTLAAIEAEQTPPTPAARPEPIPTGDDPDEPQAERDDADTDTDDEHTEGDDLPEAPDDSEVVQMLPFNVLLPADTRDVLFDAIAKAKTTHGLTTTHEALLVIARNYTNA